MLQEQWKALIHNQIQDGYYLSSYGRIRYEDNTPYEPTYHSSNGYDYSLFILKRENNDVPKQRLFPIDDLIGITFIQIPDELINKPIRINHVDNNNRNNHVSNLEWIEDVEEWRVVTYPNIKPNTYEVSSLGRIRDIKNKYISSIKCPNSRGYFTKPVIRINGNEYKEQLHRLIAYQYIINKDICKEVNHINGIKTDNTLKNLEWVTHKENMNHAYSLNMIYRGHGEELSVSKLSDDDVHEICRQFKRNWGNSLNVYKSMVELNVDVSLKQIQHIKHKECWKWISDMYWTTDDLDNLHINKIKIICSALVKYNGDVNKTIDALNNSIPYLSKRFVRIIKYKENYTDISNLYF